MSKPTLFLSDLHLSEDHPEVLPALFRLLSQAEAYQTVYFLGDIFNAWLGDDCVPTAFQPMIQAMRMLSAQDVPIFVMRGNRDFLLGQTFAEMTGSTRLTDPSIIDLYGTPTLLAHGDAYCTLDRLHQSFRTLTHSAAFGKFSRCVPIALRHKIGQQLRQASRQRTAKLSATILDVQQTAIIQALETAGVTQMIHGHTHRPADHQFKDISGKQYRRIVLPSWDDKPQAVLYHPTGDIETLSDF